MHSRALNKQRMVCGEEATDCLPAPASGCKNSYDDNARLLRIWARKGRHVSLCVQPAASLTSLSPAAFSIERITYLA